MYFSIIVARTLICGDPYTNGNGFPTTCIDAVIGTVSYNAERVGGTRGGSTSPHAYDQIRDSLNDLGIDHHQSLTRVSTLCGRPG